MCFGFSPTLTYCGTEPGYSRCYMPPPYPSRRERALGVRAHCDSGASSCARFVMRRTSLAGEPIMARNSAGTADGELASRATAAHVRGADASLFRYLPGFVYILVLFIAGKLIFPDPRATLVEWGEYHLSWVEVLMVGAAMMAMAEQLRVSHPGIDNTIEAILMAAVAALQVLLFALAAAGVRNLGIFNNTEFLMLTLISMTQAIVAILINARTLRRTIGVGDN